MADPLEGTSAPETPVEALQDAGRLAALARYDILDTPPERDFDDLAVLAAQICQTAVALITFVDGSRQFFKARAGFEGGPDAPLEAGFCPIVVRTGEALVIPDAAADAAHERNPAVRQGGVRFYAGTPLVTQDDRVIGTLCVLDRTPRPDGLAPAQHVALVMLARQVVSQLEARREAGRRLRSEQAFRLMANAVPQIIWRMEPDGAISFVNRQWSLYAGAPPGPMALSDLAERFLFPDEQALTLVELRLALGEGRVFTSEIRLRGESGEYRWFLVRLEPYREARSGRIRCWFGSATDIHDRYLAERRLADAITISHLGTFGWEPASGVMTLDARAQEIFGLPPADTFRQDDILRLIPAGKRAGILAQGRQAARSGRHLQIDYEIIRADGEERVVRSIGDVVSGGSASPHVAGVFLDITDARRAEALLQASNEDLERRVADQARAFERAWRLSQELLAIVLPGGAFEAVNPLWTECLGWTPAEMIGEKFVDYTHPDDLDATMAKFLSIFDEPLTVPFEFRIRHKNGSYRWFAWTAAFEDGRVYASGRPTTTEREQAEALRQSQKMEAVGQLTGGLAHDFNNLLTGVAGSLELLRVRIRQGRIGDADRYVGAAQDAARRAAALTHRLLAFARRQTLSPKSTSVNRLVTGMEELVRRTVGPEIVVEAVLAAGLWDVLVDPGQLENALLNLCINARDAMPGGGRIVIETANRWLDERAAGHGDLKPGQFVSLCVSDTGVGMSADIVAKAFDPFFTTKPMGQGTGLGLSMIHGFTRQSGGQSRIRSEPGRGTSVSLYLPRHLAADEIPDPAPVLANAPRARDGETVLVVDDEPTVRLFVTEVLEELGYRAIEAADGASGLAIVQSDARVDLLVTDVGLPGGLNGRQVADAARSLRPGLKILFITGYAENAVLNHGHLDHGMDVMTKPFSMEDLAGRIRTLMAG